MQTAVLETNGQLSVIKKTALRPVTTGDMRLANISEDELPCMLIADGEVNRSELVRADKSDEWLRQELARRGIKSVGDVLFAEYAADGTILWQRKIKAKKGRWR